MCSRKIFKTTLCRFVMGSTLSLVSVIAVGGIVLGLGFFDTYVGYILDWVGFHSMLLRMVCNTSTVYNIMGCTAFGTFDFIVTLIALIILAMLIGIPALIARSCCKWYRRRSVTYESIYLENDYPSAEDIFAV